MNTTIDIPKRLILSTFIILPSYAYINSKQQHPTTLFSLLCIYIAIEILFYIHFVQQRAKLQAITKPATPLNQEQRTALFWNCVHTIKDVSVWGEGWFYYKEDNSHPVFKDIKRDNMALWFAWAFWHDNLDTVLKNKAWAEEIEWMLASAEKHYGVQFPKGFNADLECIRLNLDPVEAYYRPLLMYLCLYGLTKLFDTFYLQMYWNFQESPCAPGTVWGDILGRFDVKSTCTQKISYYYRSSSTTKKTPLVFIHGIGAGVVCYAEFIHVLLSSQLDRPIFLVQLPYVAMHMVDQVPTAQETVDEITEMLQMHGYDKAVFISHSLGTGVASWIMNLKPSIVGGLVMIDPICFLLHYHNVAFNFVHRLPKTLFQYVMHYGAARELYISNYISRHFQWFETIYFTRASDINLENAAIFLSENDGIVGSANVHEYLLEQGVNAYMMKGLEHAMFLFSRKWKNTILKQIDQIATKAD